MTDLTYDHALSRIPGKWRGALAILTFVVGFLLISTVVGGAGLIYEVVTGGVDIDVIASGIVPLTPAIMLTNNLSLAAAIPLAILLQRAFFGVKGGWLASVTGRFRWRWLGRLALVIVPVWVIYVGISVALDPSGEWRFDGGVILMLAIVLVTTPLQAAGEEYGTRGLIQRSAGSWFRNPAAAFIVGTILSGAVFASAHFAADPWLIAYYFVFGVSGSIAARGTGGLEAPVLVHAVNNVLLFIPAALLGQLDQGIDRSEGTGGPFILVPMALCLAAALFSTWWARRSSAVIAADAPPTTVGQVPTQRLANSFGQAVDQYDAARPSYPEGTAEWLAPIDAGTVVDLGAGTGKFTRSLVGAGLTVIAVDPDTAMLQKLVANLPAVRAIPGTAEVIPLPDASVDAIVAAQAWHWVDTARAVREAARVLKPGGTLGLVWNIRDESVEWVHQLSLVMGLSRAEETMRTPIVIGTPFGETEQRTTRWTRHFTLDELLALVASRSAVITADEATRQRIFAGVRDLVASHPDLKDRPTIPMPYVTHAFRARLT
ncbi:hypothetical protein BH10ACT7_BH10ACT7_15310 [soil metagenome]